jgi:hypothetical protein
MRSHFSRLGLVEEVVVLSTNLFYYRLVHEKLIDSAITTRTLLNIRLKLRIITYLFLEPLV